MEATERATFGRAFYQAFDALGRGYYLRRILGYRGLTELRQAGRIQTINLLRPCLKYSLIQSFKRESPEECARLLIEELRRSERIFLLLVVLMISSQLWFLFF